VELVAVLRHELATPFRAAFSRSPVAAGLAAVAGMLPKAAINAAATVARQLVAFGRSNRRFMSLLRIEQK
jgi:hypothetical protein